jgi:hypothetical protein
MQHSIFMHDHMKKRIDTGRMSDTEKEKQAGKLRLSPAFYDHLSLKIT